MIVVIQIPFKVVAAIVNLQANALLITERLIKKLQIYKRVRKVKIGQRVGAALIGNSLLMPHLMHVILYQFYFDLG